MKTVYHVRYDFGSCSPVVESHQVLREAPGSLWLAGWGSPITGWTLPLYRPTVEAAVANYVDSCEREIAMRDAQIARLRKQIEHAKGLASKGQVQP